MLLIFGMKYFSAIQQAKARLEKILSEVE